MFLACGLNESFFMSLYMLYHQPTIITIQGLRISLWLVVAVVSAPVCAFKQIMNVIQLCGAATCLAEIDVKSASEVKQKSN
jgi:hypothetical protein